jgi:hypothetical protein
MKTENRKNRKKRFIRIKNKMTRYPECMIGEFFSNSVYEPPHDWFDYIMRHPQNSRLFYNISLVTAEVKALELASDRALDDVYQLPDWNFDTYNEYNEKYQDTEFLIAPRIKIIPYRPGINSSVVHVLGVLDEPFIDEEVFKKVKDIIVGLGCPTKGKFVLGEEKIYVPRVIKEAKAAK